MNWNAIKENIYFEDGSYRDIIVYNTTQDDWKKWIDYVTKNYHVTTLEHKTDTVKSLVDFGYITDFWNGVCDYGAVTSVRVRDVVVNAHYFIDTEIDNDITPVEVKTIEDHFGIVKYMTDISKLLDRKVFMTLENSPEIILITVDKDSIKFS